MLSNQKLQNSLNEIKEISRMDTALFTAKGKLVAHTEDMPLPEALEQQVDRKSTRLNSSHPSRSRMPSSA